MIRSISAARTAAVILALALLATPAFAHSDPRLAGGFLAGFEHPLSGPDHLLAMIAVGLWGAFLGRPLIIALPVIFPTVMAVGGVLGMIGTPMPPVEIGIALSLLLLGGAILAAWQAPVWAASLIVAIFAIFHGYAHGSELPSIADPVAFSLGFVLATGMLHLVGIAIGMLHVRPAGVALTRILGGGITVAGGYYLMMALHIGGAA